MKKTNQHLRKRLIYEAAKLMYEEGVDQYYTAKQMAVKRIFHKGGIKSTVRHKDLPSNGEISDAVYSLALMHEGDSINEQLFKMRVTALDTMASLDKFSPRLIGSVSTGRIKKNRSKS